MTTCLTTTRDDRRDPAEVCREHGWDVGTRLVGCDEIGMTEIEITAIGSRVMLARVVSQNGLPARYGPDRQWRLSDRDWHAAA